MDLTKNVEAVEKVTALTDEVEGLSAAIFASLSWSFAGSLVNTLATILRVQQPEDPRFGPRRADQNQETLESLERRLLELQDVLAWCAMRAHPEFLPSGADVTGRMVSPSERESTFAVNEIAELMELSEAEAAAFAKSEKERQSKEQALQAQQIEVNRQSIANTIDQAIKAPVTPEFELSSRDVVRILERMAEKLEQYEQNRVSRAFTTRRRRTIVKLAAERKLIANAMNVADEMAERVSQAEDAKAEDVVQGSVRVG